MLGRNPRPFIGADAPNVVQENAAKYFGYIEPAGRENLRVEQQVELLHQYSDYQLNIDVGAKQVVAAFTVELLL